MQQRNPFDQFDAPAGGMPAGAVLIAPPDPGKAYDGPQAAATLRKTEADIAANAEEQRRKGAVAPFDARKSKAEAAIAELNLAKAAAEARKAGGGGVDPAAGLQRAIIDMRAAYAAGPGATSGLSGLQDFLPTQANSAFNKAASAARGYVGPALGLTASQLNSPGEIEAAIGPYIATASDYDKNIESTFRRLEGLANDQRKRAGYTGPIEQPRGIAPPAPATPPQMEIATGATRNVRDPNVEAVVDAMIRSGADAATINAAIAPLGGSGVQQDTVDRARRYLKENPGYKGGFSDTSRSEANSLRARAAASVPGAFAASALNEAAAGLPGAVFGTENLDAQKRAFPNATAAGGLVGSTAGLIGTELALGRAGARLGGMFGRTLSNPRVADAAFGGVSGATSTPDNRWLGAAAGAGLGAAGGYVGDKVAGAAGRVLRGVVNPEARYLASRGVPLTAGQAAGGTLKGLEDRLTGVSGLGDIVNSRRNEGLDVYERLAFNDASAPLQRQTVPLNLQTPDVGARGIEQLNAIRSTGYANAVGGRSASFDPQFQTDYVRAYQAASAIPKTGQEVADEINAVVPSYFDNGTITGENAQAAIRELKGLRASRKNDALGHRTGEAVRQAEAAVTGLFDRQAPGFSNDLAAANLVNTNYKVLERAVTSARNAGERLMPSQLNNASVASATRFGGNPASTSRPFYELAQAGQAVLPSKIPDSGTAGRLALLALPGALGGGYQGSEDLKGTATGAAAGGTISSLALGGLLAAGGTKAGQRILVAGLMDRNPVMVQIGESLIKRRGVGGMFGGGFAASVPGLLAPPQ